MNNSLAAVLAASPLIESAFVNVSPRSFRRIGRGNDVPTASVSLKMARGKSITREMVQGWAEFIAGAVQGLQAHDVTIQDQVNGRSYHVPRPEDALNTEYLEHVKEFEEHLAGKILNLVRVPGAMVEVAVELDTDRTTTKKITLGKPQPQQELRDETTSGQGEAPTEGGVRANTGVALGAAGAGSSNSSQKEETRFYPPTVEQEELTSKAGFTARHVTATVSVPRSYIVSLFKNKNPDAGEPAEQDLDADRTAQLDRIRKIASTIIRSDSPSDVNVDVYPDMIWTPSGGAWSPSPGAATVMAVEAGGGGDTVALVTRYGPQGALACLALVSLFMMMRIVRKSAAHMPPLPTGSTSVDDREEDEESDEILAVGSGAVGQAQRGDSFLTAKELDEDMLQEMQITSEVSRMIEDDPEAAAELLKTWITEGD
jgi:flagellar biosynthesis/type III secretory pathway M-ring protein FliF/YscJ